MDHKDLINACSEDWDAYSKHEFVEQLAQGNLPQPCYLHYLKQDFLFLKQYARAYALAIYKSHTLADMRNALPSVSALLDCEISHHTTYCAQWGLNESDLEAENEDFGTVAYTRYVLDAGMSGDLVDLYAALAPCSIGYAQIGRRLLSEADSLLTETPYRTWIELYGGEEFQKGAAQGIQYFDSLLAEIPVDSQRGRNLIKVFQTATRMEIAFWQQGLNAMIEGKV